MWQYDSISLALYNEHVTPALVQSPTVSEDTLFPPRSDESVALELDANKSDVNKPPIHQKLIDWYNKYYITLAAVKELLDIIKPDYPSFPTDPRTSLKTENNLGQASVTIELLVSNINKTIKSYYFLDQCGKHGSPNFKNLLRNN